MIVLAACGGVPQSTPASQMSGMEHDMPQSDLPYDALFVDSMIVHHQGAIDMANQALNEASKAEIKTLAENIIKTQTAEINQLKEWRQAWYPDLAETKGMGMAMGAMAVSDDTARPFDQRFIEAMIPHHEGAISMAGDAQQKAQHEEIKRLADTIIAAQTAEITEMKQWLKDWYGQ